VVIAEVGALLGAGLWLLLTPGYQTSTNVLLQGSRTSDELVTETQVAMSSVVLDRTAAALGWNVTRHDLQGEVGAVVGDGNVIIITGRAGTPERAQQLTDAVAREYVNFSTQLATDAGDVSAQVFREQRETLRQEITKVNERITELQTAAAGGSTPDAVQLRSELQELRTTLTQAMAKLDEAGGGSGQNNIVVMGLAERPSGRAAPTLVQLAAGGALVAFLLGVFGHFAAARWDRRLRDDAEIAAALGSEVLATVDVTDEPTADRGAKRSTWKSLVKGLVLGRQPWYETPLPVAGDDLSRDIRYRRALARLRGDTVGPLRVLVLVPDDDAAAHRAAAQLAAAAETQPHRILLQTVEVAVGRPTVPDGGGVWGALVVLTSGSRTDWELVGLAEACADAGHRVVGTVVAHLTRSAGRRQEEQRPVAQDVLAGSP
jgi:capsular polysaccharide biosynthesis protein